MMNILPLSYQLTQNNLVIYFKYSKWLKAITFKCCKIHSTKLAFYFCIFGFLENGIYIIFTVITKLSFDKKNN
jgi:hypothetical protein